MLRIREYSLEIFFHRYFDSFESFNEAFEKAGLPADAHVIESPNRGGPFEALQEMFEVRLGLTRAAIQAIPGLERGLLKVKLMQRIAADRICCVAPELTDLTQPISK